MKYTAELWIPLKTLAEAMYRLEHNTAFPDIKDGAVALEWTVEFDDTRQADVKIVSQQPLEGGPWSEVVLFDAKGNELMHTEVLDYIEGSFDLEYRGDSYHIEVFAEDN